MNAVEHIEIKELTKKVDDLMKLFGTQRSEIKEIRDALLGNEFSEKVGIVKRVSELEEKVDKLEKYFNNVKWFLIGLAFVAGAGSGKIISALVNAL